MSIAESDVIIKKSSFRLMLADELVYKLIM